MQNIYKNHMVSVLLFICLAFERYENARYTKSYGFAVVFRLYTKKNYTFQTSVKHMCVPISVICTKG